MRDISQLHPYLQEKIEELIKRCEKKGIKIGIGECYRTVSEQNALYAKGRTAPGAIVTNAKGSSYSSMHQWGVAFDFYLKMDIDGDGKTSDDTFNDSKNTFAKVGKIGMDLGLEWGGSWKFKDKPHFQLPDWGSTPTKLKSLYGTPDNFKKSWPIVAAAKTDVNFRDAKAKIISEIKKGSKIHVIKKEAKPMTFGGTVHAMAQVNYNGKIGYISAKRIKY